MEDGFEWSDGCILGDLFRLRCLAGCGGGGLSGPLGNRLPSDADQDVIQVALDPAIITKAGVNASAITADHC